MTVLGLWIGPQVPLSRSPLQQGVSRAELSGVLHN